MTTMTATTATTTTVDTPTIASTPDHDDFGRSKLQILTEEDLLDENDDDDDNDDMEDVKTIARYKTHYGTSRFEQTWCDVEELYQCGQYVQALALFEKGHGAHSGATFLLDKEVEQRAKIQAQLNLKALTDGTTDEDKHQALYNDLVGSLCHAIYRRGSAQVELQNLLWRVLETRVQQLIPQSRQGRNRRRSSIVKDGANTAMTESSDNYNNVSTSRLVQAGQVWLTWFELWSDYYVTVSMMHRSSSTLLLPRPHQCPHECLQRIASTLANRRELVACRALVQRAAVTVPLVNHDGSTWMHVYLGVDAECAEAVNDLESAHQAYTTMFRYQERCSKERQAHASNGTIFYDETATGGMGYTQIASPGSLAERMNRTAQKVNICWTITDPIDDCLIKPEESI